MKFVFYSIITILAIVASVVAFKLSDSSIPQSNTPTVVTKEINIKTVDVLVARVNIPIGTIIDNSMLDKQPWPENLVLESFILGDESGQELVGKVARSAISAHEPFMKSKIANPNDPGFLAAGLPAGMRAITVATDAVAGIAGFIFPGDHVDLLFTHDVKDGSGTAPSGKPSVTEVIASNVKVLAINLRDDGLPKNSSASPNSVTLEVTEEQAQQFRLAEKNGTLSFSLRSIHDNSRNSPTPTTISDLSHNSSQSDILSVVRGPGGNATGRITTFNILSILPDDGNDGDASANIVRGVASEANKASATGQNNSK